MSEKYYEKWEFEPGSLICDQCGAAMEPGEIVLHYMGSDFPVLMPKCPVCGQASYTGRTGPRKDFPGGAGAGG